MTLKNDALDFLEEIKKKDENDYLKFIEYQTLAINTLRDFHKLCEESGITYYLAYGSVLGLVRHKHQIPWDYDIDVWVPFSESDKLIQAIDSKLSDKYHYTTRLIDKKCRTYTMKIAPIGYDCEILHVDVFWLGGASKNEKIRNNTKKLGDKYHNTMLNKYTDIKYLGINGRVQKWAHRIVSLPAKLCPSFILEKKFKKLISKETEDSSWLTDIYYVFPKELFKDIVKLEDIDGFEYNVPCGYYEILKLCYGDYAQIPSLENRYKEYQDSFKRLNELAKIK